MFNPQMKKAFSNINKSTEETEKEQREERSLDYQRRQTVSSEEAVAQAEKANKIAEKALKKSKIANIISGIACGVSLLSILAAILIGIYC